MSGGTFIRYLRVLGRDLLVTLIPYEIDDSVKHEQKYCLWWVLPWITRSPALCNPSIQKSGSDAIHARACSQFGVPVIIVATKWYARQPPISVSTKFWISWNSMHPRSVHLHIHPAAAARCPFIDHVVSSVWPGVVVLSAWSATAGNWMSSVFHHERVQNVLPNICIP